MTPAGKVALQMGARLLVCPVWHALTHGGALVGLAILAVGSLDFAVPGGCIALTGPVLQPAAHRKAAGFPVPGSATCAGLPRSLGILAAAQAVIVAGAQMEWWMKRLGRA